MRFFVRVVLDEARDVEFVRAEVCACNVGEWVCVDELGICRVVACVGSAEECFSVVFSDVFGEVVCAK